ncbi:MAG: hypothetical protein IPH45_21415 [Bacteroidales bacterium]|nr:hypothetical protein [Bacteroidales bacterium]
MTYTNGVTPVTVNNIMSSPYTFTVNPPVTTGYWVVACSDAFCTAPGDSLKGLASITVFPLAGSFSMNVDNEWRIL